MNGRALLCCKTSDRVRRTEQTRHGSEKCHGAPLGADSEVAATRDSARLAPRAVCRARDEIAEALGCPGYQR